MADNAPSNTDAQNKPEGNEDAPWGDDFDAARAWKLVTNLRAEKDALKAEKTELVTERDALKTSLQEKEDSKKSDEDKLADRIAAIEKRAQEAERKLTLANVLRDFPTLADFEDLLTGDTEEAIRSKAERLAKIGAKDAADDNDDEQEQAPAGVHTKPTPSLKPGHGGDETPAFDPKAIAEAARSASV